MPKSRARADGAEAPPAKRHKADKGLENILLNPKGNASLPKVHTTKVNGMKTARINEEDVAVKSAKDPGDVVASGARTGGKEVVELSSDSSSSDGESEEEEEAAVEEEAVVAAVNGTTNGVEHSGNEAVDEDGDATAGADEAGDPMDEDDKEELTFGERLEKQQDEPIDVEAVLAAQEASSSDEAAQRPTRTVARIPTGATFSTVLTQALRTTDSALLDSCFDTNDLEAVRETLSRIDSRLTVPLMQRIAERVAASPGRLGNLMVWIQWAIIAHGGYLAGIPEMRRRLAGLYQVIEMRAQGLQPLLQLKGKLDMLAAQGDIRREEQERNLRAGEEESADMTIYVQGMSDASDSEDSDEELGQQQIALLNGVSPSADGGMGSVEAGANLGAFANGVVSADVERSDRSDSGNDLVDDEAEEDDEDGEDDSEDSDEEDSD